MICPKCKHEVMNVNGRYVCVECGSEFTEDQLESDQAQESLTNEVATPEETMPTVNNPLPEAPVADLQSSEETGMPEAPASETTEVSTPAEQPIDIMSDVQESQPEPGMTTESENISETPEPSLEAPEVPVSFDTEMPAAEPIMAELQSEPTVSTLTELPTTDTAESTEMPVSTPEPMISEVTQPEVSTPEIEVPELPTETPEPSVADFMPTEPALAGDTAVEQEATPALEFTPPQDDEVVVPQALEPQPVMPTEVQAPVLPDIPESQPIASSYESAVATPSAMNNSSIYQNPIFDQPQNDAVVGIENGKSDEELAREKISNDNRKMYTILIVGVVVFILFIVAGIFAYMKLTG